MKQVHHAWIVSFAVTVCMIVATTSASSSSLRGKPRTTRGFKIGALSTARGFGKRAGLDLSGDYLADDTRLKGFGDDLRDIPDAESFPVDWFVDELTNNPQLARIVVQKFVDLNQDGILTVDELFRNPAY